MNRLALFCTCFVLLVGCGKLNESRHQEQPIRPDQTTDFNTLYRRHCAGCHGADGQFGPAPPLNDPLFLAIVPASVVSMVISEGRYGTPMPAFSRENGGPLSEEQVKALAEGIKGRWKAEQPATPPPAYLAPGGKVHADAGRGGQVFERACASCHGKDGLGGKEMVGPINDASFLALISDQAVRRIIITGRRDLEMPSFAGKASRTDDYQPLSSQDVSDLVEFVAGWRRKPNAGRVAEAASK